MTTALTRDERLLLARVNRTLRSSGWHRDNLGRLISTDQLVKVDWDGAGVSVWRRDVTAQIWPSWPVYYRVSTVTQAVDLLAALNVLPAHVSSAFWAGRKSAALDIQRMDHELGDAGWTALEEKAAEAGYPVEWVRRRRGDFTTTTIEGAYQYGYRRAADVAWAGVR